MISRDKLLEEEKLDMTIESLLGKITQVIIAYKLRDQDSEEASNISKISTRLEQFMNIYNNELKLFETDRATADVKRKEIESKLIEDLGIILKDLNEYKEEINRMVEKILHNQNITREYDEILRVHDEYIKKADKVNSYVHALE